MTFAQKDCEYSNFLLDLERPYHMADGFRVIEMDFPSKMFYAAYVTDEDNSTLIFIATPDENLTLELIKTVNFYER